MSVSSKWPIEFNAMNDEQQQEEEEVNDEGKVIANVVDGVARTL